MNREAQILQARAREWARPVEQGIAAGASALSFRLGGEKFALDSSVVGEVFKLERLTRLPGAAPPLLGLTSHRGALLQVLDLRMALGLSPSSLDDLGWVVKVGSAGNSFGVLVDHLDQVVDLNIGDISAGTGRKGGNPGLIRGVTVDAVTVLDGTAILGLHSQER